MNVIEEGERKEEFKKRKRDERKKTSHVTRAICRENQEHCTQVFRKVDKK